MLSAVLNVPDDERSFQAWSFDHANAVSVINAAIQAQGGGTLPNRQLFPINPAAIDLYLQNVSQAHQAITAAVGIQSSDLLDVDLQDKNQRVVWVNQVWRDLFDASTRLGIGP